MNADDKLDLILASVERLESRLSFGFSTSSTDGLVPPDGFRFDGKLFGGLALLEWRLFSRLWGHDAVEMNDLVDYVYGDQEDGREVALRSLLKRVRKKLSSKSCPLTVVSRNGMYALKLPSN